MMKERTHFVARRSSTLEPRLQSLAIPMIPIPNEHHMILQPSRNIHVSSSDTNEFQIIVDNF